LTGDFDILMVRDDWHELEEEKEEEDYLVLLLVAG